MANFKRHKPKQQVACTLCTADRWRGNHKGRFKAGEEADRQAGAALGERRVKTKSPKRNWSRNKRICSLTGRLKHLRPKLAAHIARGGGRVPECLVTGVRAMYETEIAHCERELAELET